MNLTLMLSIIGAFTLSGLQVISNTKKEIDQERKPYREHFKQGSVKTSVENSKEALKQMNDILLSNKDKLTPTDVNEALDRAEKNKQQPGLAKVLTDLKADMPALKRKNEIAVFFAAQWQKWFPKKK